MGVTGNECARYHAKTAYVSNQNLCLIAKNMIPLWPYLEVSELAPTTANVGVLKNCFTAASIIDVQQIVRNVTSRVQGDVGDRRNVCLGKSEGRHIGVLAAALDVLRNERPEHQQLLSNDMPSVVMASFACDPLNILKFSIARAHLLLVNRHSPLQIMRRTEWYIP